MRSELRKDYIQEKYVIISPRRSKRPHDVRKHKSDDSPHLCVFCPRNLKNVKASLTYGGKGGWDIKVIKNIYPAVTLNNPHAYGVQEVVVETPNHNIDLDELPEKHIEKLLYAYAKRTEAITKVKKIQYIIIFKNQGAQAGASLHHAHSQIFATNFLPPHLFNKSQRVQAYKLEHGTCVYCDVIKKEGRGPRRVFKNKHIVAFTPYASMHNYEIWIMPIRHIDNITLMNREEIKSFAYILKRVLKKIKKLNLDYNYYFHQVVYDNDQHLYIKITPRGSVWAGVEIGSGVVINPVSPEYAAAQYRK